MAPSSFASCPWGPRTGRVIASTIVTSKAAAASSHGSLRMPWCGAATARACAAKTEAGGGAKAARKRASS